MNRQQADAFNAKFARQRVEGMSSTGDEAAGEKPWIDLDGGVNERCATIEEKAGRKVLNIEDLNSSVELDAEEFWRLVAWAQTRLPKAGNK